MLTDESSPSSPKSNLKSSSRIDFRLVMVDVFSALKVNSEN